MQSLRRLGETLAPRLSRRERHLQGTCYGARAAEDAVQRYVVLGLRAADGNIHVRPPFALQGTTRVPADSGEGSRLRYRVAQVSYLPRGILVPCASSSTTNRPKKV